MAAQRGVASESRTKTVSPMTAGRNARSAAPRPCHTPSIFKGTPMLDASKLVQQVEVMALHYAIQAALAGEIPWTGELAQEYNKRWLARSAPAIYKVIPNADEEAICADEQCGGFCVLVGIDLKDSHYYFTHECQTCLRRYRVEDRVYLSSSKEGEVVQVSVAHMEK